MRKTISFAILMMCAGLISAQAVRINTDNSAADPSAILDIKSTSKGMLIPRMTSVQRGLISAPASGLLVYDDTTQSFWFYNGTSWVNLLTSNSGWSINGNNTGPGAFVGTTNNESLLFKANNQQAGKIDVVASNTLIGINAGNLITTGFSNTAHGYNSLFSNTEGYYNTATGRDALYSNTSGFHNTALGADALRANTEGYGNTSIGTGSLFTNSTGFSNTACGENALRQNNSNHNTAI